MNIFARPATNDTFHILHNECGSAVRKLENATSVYPVDSALSCAYEHPQGIMLSKSDVVDLGIEIEH